VPERAINAAFREGSIEARYPGRRIGLPARELHGAFAGRLAVTFKTALLAIVAAAALIGAAIIGVPSTAQKSERAPVTFRVG
jgi:hypothetical protein